MLDEGKEECLKRLLGTERTCITYSDKKKMPEILFIALKEFSSRIYTICFHIYVLLGWHMLLIYALISIYYLINSLSKSVLLLICLMSHMRHLRTVKHNMFTGIHHIITYLILCNCHKIFLTNLEIYTMATNHCWLLTHKDLFCCTVQKYMHILSHGQVKSLLLQHTFFILWMVIIFGWICEINVWNDC
jgi:hypothetical protein